MLILGVQDGAKFGQDGPQIEASGGFEAIIRFNRRSERDLSEIVAPESAGTPEPVLETRVPGPPGPGESGSGLRGLPKPPNPFPGYM